jgi:hypothetical protein
MCQRQTCSPVKALSPPGIEKKQTGKVVRFSESTTVGYVSPSSYYTPQELRQVWYQPADYELFKETARFLSSKESLKSPLSEFEEFYPHAISMSVEEKQRQQQHLNRWCRQRPSRRGLERWIHTDYASQVQFECEQRRRMVLKVQARLKGQEDMDEGIRAVSEACSYNSRTFSLMLGAADEYAEKHSLSSFSLKQAIENGKLPIVTAPISLLAAPKKETFSFMRKKTMLSFAGRIRRKSCNRSSA